MPVQYRQVPGVDGVQVSRVEFGRGDAGVSYTVWERGDGRWQSATHSTISEIGGELLGSYMARRNPALEALAPGSKERVHAFNAWHAKRLAEARALVLIAYPDAADADLARL